MKAHLSTWLIGCFIAALAPIGALRAAEECGDVCGQRPADICIMMDRTGSVSLAARTNEAQAAKALIDTFGTGDDGFRFAIGRLGDNVDGGEDAEIAYPASGLGDAFSDKTNLKNAVDSAMSSSSSVGTNLEDAVEACRRRLQMVVDPNPIQVIILLTDGEPNENDTDAEDDAEGDDHNAGNDGASRDAANEAEAAGMLVFTIAYDAETGVDGDAGDRDLVADMASGFALDDHCDDDANLACTGSEIDLENGDGDNFFISLDPDDPDAGTVLLAIFDSISEFIECHDEDPCTKDICNEEADCCEHSTVDSCQACGPDLPSCDDGDVCNGEETCGEDSTCDDGTPLDCTDYVGDTQIPNLCTLNDCDPSDGCVNTQKGCDDGNPCTDDSCAPVNGECIHTPNVENSCSDGDVCNGGEVCDLSGQCVSAGSPLSCDDGNPCTDDLCVNPGNELRISETQPADPCVHTPDETNECSDGDACNGLEQCALLRDGESVYGAECAPGSSLVCNDGDSCTNDSCDPASGCESDPIPDCPPPEVPSCIPNSGGEICGNGADDDCDGLADAADTADCDDDAELAGCIALPGNGPAIVNFEKPKEVNDGIFEIPFEVTDPDGDNVTTKVTVSEGTATIGDGVIVYSLPKPLSTDSTGEVLVTATVSDSGSCQENKYTTTILLSAAGDTGLGGCALVR